MALEQIGFQAVIQGLNTFLSGTAQIEKAQGRVEGSTKKAGDAFGAFQKIALASAAAGAAAVLGLGVASLKMAADFDKGMREVNSIAKLSESGFKQLEKDTLAFSKSIGIAANEVVPALYQALSAGVPVDNVFEFMRVAGEAAIGGVTTLETAVDGLTSVVNAYGAATLPAARAADIMFKAVEVGKTTFEELSMNLADVVPTAVAAGVSFEEVAAAVATMTVQGIRTTIATTSLNQALVELQKPMPPLAAVMEKAAKKIGAADGSFKSMKASGASLETILIALEDAAAEMGLSLTQVFGSVEASKAVLSLTGQSAEIAAKHFDQVKNSAGSARAAFEELNKSAARQFEIFKTKVTATMIELGTKALPVIIAGLEELNVLFPKVAGAGARLASTLASIAKFAADNKVQVGLFIGILAVPKILGAASALLQMAGAMRAMAAARIGQVGTDYAFFAKSLAGAPMLTRTLGPLLMTLGTLAGPLALGGIAVAAVAASVGIENLIPFLHKGESATERFARQAKELKDRFDDIARSVWLGKIDEQQASIFRVANVMKLATDLARDYVGAVDDLGKAKGLVSAAQQTEFAAAAQDKMVRSLADVLRQADLSATEIEALSGALYQAGGRTREGNEAYGLLLRALELVAPATAAQAGATKEAAKQAAASLTPLQQQAGRFEEIAKRATDAMNAIKGYDDVTKGVVGALTTEQLATDAEIATLKRRKQQLVLTGQADSQAAKDIDARIQRLEDERELVNLSVAELVAKGRAEEFLRKVRDGSIKTDRDKLAAVLDVLEAVGADVSKEREALGIYPLVTQAAADQAVALGAIGPAAEMSAGQVEGATDRIEEAIKGPQQEQEELLELLRDTGPTAILQIPAFDTFTGRARADEDLLIRGMNTLSQGILGLGPKVLAQGSFFQRFAAIANAALESIRIAQLAAAIEAANRALSSLGLRLPVPSAPASEGRQFGGSMYGGQARIVGETQPEIWIPRSPGVVARPQQLQLGGAGLGPTFAPTITVSGATLEQMEVMALGAVRRAFREARYGAVRAGATISGGIS